MTAKLFIFAIQIYKRFISPLMRHRCRYYPSCSEYAADAVKKYGALKGLFLSIKRILKCNPFYPGGYDPVV